jgi:hypothetical protein
VNTQYSGHDGTYYTCRTPVRGATLGLANGIALSSELPSNPTGVRLERTVHAWTAGTLRWTDDSSDLPGAALANTASYRITGLTPDQDLRVYDNGADLLGSATNTGPAGTISFSVTLDGPRLIEISGPRGTLFVVR